MEVEILNTTVEKINELIGIDCRVLNEEIQIKNNYIDAEIVIQHNNLEERFFVEIKKKILPNDIPRIIEKSKSIKALIYLADYITPKAKELMRFNTIPYVDTAGNMFLRNEHIYIIIQTKKTNRDKLKTNTKAFNKAGLKVIYQFLIRPELLNKSYRNISEIAKVAIATVGVVIKDLLKENYVVQINDKKYKFRNRENLFRDWVKEYNRNLRPKLRTKKYSWLSKNKNWKKIKLPKETYWGGVNAAERLTEYLIADKVEIYTGLKFEEVMNSMKMIPDSKGIITVTEMFWENQNHDVELINPILIYADLLNDPNTRHLEAANLIYRDHVQNKL